MAEEMNGAESLVRTLLAGDVNVCFTNPGTSEMHFVAALDKVPGMRCVLGLFEGVVTGAADGYYRMLGKPASTLLHLGPGLANGLANLHNAKKANSGIVNIVGEHATYHIAHDAPLTSDIEGVARPMSHWVKTSPNSRTIAADGALAIAAARQTPGQIATLILPADTAWGPADGIAETAPRAALPKVSEDAVKAAAALLREGKRATLLMGGDALRAPCLELAGRIAAKTGCGILTEGANTRLERGAGRVQKERKLTVRIPAGIATGQRLRLSGEGEGGAAGGPAGDLYVVLIVQDHPFFQRDGNDLHCEVPVNFPTLALGGSIMIPTLDGGEEAYEVPDGTQSGATLRLSGRGMPDVNGRGRGDLLVTLKVVTPRKLSREQKKLLEQLAASLPKEKFEPTPREHEDRNLFERVKDIFG